MTALCCCSLEQRHCFIILRRSSIIVLFVDELDDEEGVAQWRSHFLFYDISAQQVSPVAEQKMHAQVLPHKHKR